MDFTLAYLVVWVAVVLYVARLGTEQRRQAQALEQLQRQWAEQSETEWVKSRAA